MRAESPEVACRGALDTSKPTESVMSRWAKWKVVNELGNARRRWKMLREIKSQIA